MRKAVLATLIVCPAFAAAAQEQPTDFLQTFEGTQAIEQTIDAGDLPAADLQSLTDPTLEQADAPDLSQTGSNFLNMVLSGEDLSTVTQQFNGQQLISNSIVAGALNSLGAITQTGSNVAGIASGATIDMADQLMGSDALQHVHNQAALNSTFQSISQTGINIANLAIAEYAIGSAYQEIEMGAQQIIDNDLYIAAGSAVAGFISQGGTNFGNILVSDKIDSVRRIYAGDQIVNNTVYIDNIDAMPAIAQSGSNVANLIMANHIGSIEQISVGTQVVNNQVIGPDGEILSGPSISQTEQNSMGETSDVVNMAAIGDGRGISNADMSISQTSDFSQSSNGSASSGQAGNVVSINR